MPDSQRSRPERFSNRDSIVSGLTNSRLYSSRLLERIRAFCNFEFQVSSDRSSSVGCGIVGIFEDESKSSRDLQLASPDSGVTVISFRARAKDLSAWTAKYATHFPKPSTSRNIRLHNPITIANFLALRPRKRWPSERATFESPRTPRRHPLFPFPLYAHPADLRAARVRNSRIVILAAGEGGGGRGKKGESSLARSTDCTRFTMEKVDYTAFKALPLAHPLPFQLSLSLSLARVFSFTPFSVREILRRGQPAWMSASRFYRGAIGFRFVDRLTCWTRDVRNRQQSAWVFSANGAEIWSEISLSVPVGFRAFARARTNARLDKSRGF